MPDMVKVDTVALAALVGLVLLLLTTTVTLLVALRRTERNNELLRQTVALQDQRFDMLQRGNPYNPYFTTGLRPPPVSEPKEPEPPPEPEIDVAPPYEKGDA